ncbi:MAG: ABC transporter substrate-binding protein [Oscillospiraceae bacterium]|nr:ABC transporter substrate-binding protein [Oscillospiraceae bacterium]
MKKFKKITALIMAALMGLTILAACGPSPAAPGDEGAAEAGGGTASLLDEVAQPGEVTIVEATPPVGENVRFAEEIDIIYDMNIIAVLNAFLPGSTAPPHRMAFTLMYDTLIDPPLNLGDDWLPRLATSWETEDYQHFIFTLRDDVYFQNGEKFNAEDVFFTVAMAHDNPGTMSHTSWRGVNMVNIINDYKIEIVLEAVDVDFLHLLSLPGAHLINRVAVDADPERGWWVGTGSYIITEFHASDFLVLEANPNYWGEAPRTQRLILRHVPEASARTIMLQNDQVQVCFSITPADKPMFQNDPENFSVFPWVLTSPNFLTFNFNDPITGCWYFRRAVAHIVDPVTVARAANGDWAFPWEHGTIWGFGTEFMNYDIPLVPYDPDLARSYLERSVWNGETVDLHAAHVNNIRAIEFLQEEFRRIGVPINIITSDVAGLASVATYHNNTSQMVLHVGTLTDNASSIRNFLLPGSATNRSSYNNPRILELLNLASATGDRAEREAIYHEIQWIASDDLAYICVYMMMQAAVTVNGVGGMILRSDNNNDIRGIYRIIQD